MSARSLNKVMLIGNLTRDPELRYTPNGSAVCTFGMATNRSYKPSDSNEVQEETEFHRVVAWGKLAEICSQLLYKGRKVYCDGRLQTRKWTGQDGAERVTTEVVIENMIALSPPRGAEGREDYGAGAAGSAGQSAAAGTGVADPTVVAVDGPAGSQPLAEEAVESEKAKKAGSSGEATSRPKDEVDVDDIPF